MPSTERRLELQIEEYLDKKVKHRRLSPDQRPKYLRVLNQASNAWMDAGLETRPKRIGEKEIEHLLAETWVEASPQYQKWMVSIVSGFLEYNDNRAIKKMMLSWPSEYRQNVDWLIPEEAVSVLDSARGVKRIITHLELRLWMRRVELLRLTQADVQEGLMQVLGKGKAGGKWRTLAWAPDTLPEFEHYSQLREEMVERAREYDPNVKDPDSWIIYQKGRLLSGYGETAIDNLVQQAGLDAGIARKLGNHTLRRTGARLAYFAGERVEEISEYLGHSNTRMTRRYLGLNVEDNAKMQVRVCDYMEQVRKGMTGTLVSSSIPAMRISR
jgi:integrase